MAKLCEGNRAFTAVANNAVLSADHNDLQDQLKAMLGPRQVDILSCFPVITGAWDWPMGGADYGWDVTANTGNSAVLPFAVGQRVTAAKMFATRSGLTDNAGSFGIYKQELDAAVPLPTLIGQLLTPWAAGAADTLTWREIDDDGSSGEGFVGAAFTGFTIESGYVYYMRIAGIAGRTHQIHAATVTAQFGN